MNPGATLLFLATIWFVIEVGFVVGCIRGRLKAESLVIDARYGLAENPPTPSWESLKLVLLTLTPIWLTFYLLGLIQLANG